MHAARRRDSVSDFLDSMPWRYREVFDGPSAREHAAIVARRAGSPAHVELRRRLPRDGAVVCVAADDCPGLLLAITRALHRARVQILGSDATTKDGRVVDSFTLVELDGAPLRSSRRGVLQVEVLAAVDSLGR